MSYNYYYNMYCNSDARNCASGCCTSTGACATSSSNCVYKYYDYSYNSNYYYYGTSSNKWNSNCNSNSHYCVSGCCTSSGSCATTSSSCYYRYSDYYTNSSYYFPGNSVTPNPTCYSQSCYNAQVNKTLAKQYGISLGISFGYLIFFIIGAIICYCKRKPMVEAINRLGTHNEDGTAKVSDPNQPPQTYFIDPACLQRPVNPTYSGQSPNRNAILPFDGTLNNINNSLNEILYNNNSVPRTELSPQKGATPVIVQV